MLIWFVIAWRILMKTIFNLCNIMLGDMMEVGMLNFVKHRAMTMENWVCFTYHNVLDCVTMLDENKMKKEVGFFSCWGFNAYNSNKPNLSYVTSHVVLFCDIKMDYQTLKSLRKCMVVPHTVDLQTSFIYFMSIICWVQNSWSWKGGVV